MEGFFYCFVLCIFVVDENGHVLLSKKVYVVIVKCLTHYIRISTVSNL